jgi:hypothetical protein
LNKNSLLAYSYIYFRVIDELRYGKEALFIFIEIRLERGDGVTSDVIENYVENQENQKEKYEHIEIINFNNVYIYLEICVNISGYLQMYTTQ